MNGKKKEYKKCFHRKKDLKDACFSAINVYICKKKQRFYTNHNKNNEKHLFRHYKGCVLPR